MSGRLRNFAIILFSLGLFAGIVAQPAQAQSMEQLIYDYLAPIKGDAFARQAISVARCESSLNPNATNYVSPDYSIGLFQINMLVHGERFGTEAQLKNPYTNMAGMIILYDERNSWGAWSCGYAASTPWNGQTSTAPPAPAVEDLPAVQHGDQVGRDARPALHGTDKDEDGILWQIDNCPTVSNYRQLDADDNGIGNACDDTWSEYISLVDSVCGPNVSSWISNGFLFEEMFTDLDLLSEWTNDTLAEVETDSYCNIAFTLSYEARVYFLRGTVALNDRLLKEALETIGV